MAYKKGSNLNSYNFRYRTALASRVQETENYKN
jgi:hypothetical protein